VSWWFVDVGHDLAVVIRMLYLAIVQVFGWLALPARRRRGEDCGVARSATGGSSLTVGLGAGSGFRRVDQPAENGRAESAPEATTLTLTITAFVMAVTANRCSTKRRPGPDPQFAKR
jgi:hypothetical protein